MAMEDVCIQIFGKYAALGNMINRSKNAIQAQINLLQSAVTDLVVIPQVEIDDMCDGIDGLDISIPIDLSSAEKSALVCLMGSICPGFDMDKINLATDWLDLPVNLLQRYLNSVQTKFGDTIKGLLDVNIFGQAGDLLGSLDGLIKSTGMYDILNQLDALLICLNAGCSAFYPSAPDYAGDMRSTLGLTGSNSFDTSIFSTWNPVGGVVTQLNQVSTSVRNANASVTSLTLPGL